MKESRRRILQKSSILAGLLVGVDTISAARNEYPDWEPDIVYTAGDRIGHDGYIWEAQWWTRGETPRSSLDVWKRLRALDESYEYLTWYPENVYEGGDRVVHEGYIWDAQWWTRGDEPTGAARVWKRYSALDESYDHPTWYLENVYEGGDRVVHDGYVWEAQWWTHGDEPSLNASNGPWDQIGQAGNDRPQPAEPTGVEAVELQSTRITLEWNALNGISSYRVYRRTTDNGSAGEKTAVGETTDPAFTDDGLDEGTEYTYEVTATMDGVEGPPSSPVTARTTESAPGDPHSEQRIVGYYTSWSRYDQEYYPSDVPLEKVTHLSYAFMDVESDGTVTFYDQYADPINLDALRDLKEQHPETTMQLSIGGWTLSEHFSDAALTRENRERFAQTAIDLMREYDFDGIDIDWEYPDGGGAPGNTEREEDPENFVLLLEEVRRQLDDAATTDGQEYELSIAAATDPHKAAALDVPAIAEYVDFVSVMNYDYTGTWSSVTNHNGKLYAADDDPGPDRYSGDAGMKGWAEEGMPKEKLVYGTGFFGYGFVGVPGENNGLYQPFDGAADLNRGDPGETDYPYVSDLLASQPSYERHWDDEAKVPYVYSADDGVFITYEDVDSVGIKAEYVQEHQYGGMMFWEFYGDRDETLLDEITTVLGE